ncbi:MAG: 16S rRNA processing protein RimM [Firmicutes bacterium]|nr:16S rRNA processing protein RimM [Bacillota bacterium]
MEKIKLGQIVTAVGIKGEVKVYPYTDIPERFEEIDSLMIESKNAKINGVRYMKNMVILRLEGVDDRNAAEALRGKNLYIDRKDMWEMPEDTYLVKDLLGMTVMDPEGNRIGKLVDVIQNSAQDLYEIEREDGKKFLLPAVGEFVQTVNLNKRIMIVRLIEGLVEL